MMAGVRLMVIIGIRPSAKTGVGSTVRSVDGPWIYIRVGGKGIPMKSPSFPGSNISIKLSKTG